MKAKQIAYYGGIILLFLIVGIVIYISHGKPAVSKSIVQPVTQAMALPAPVKQLTVDDAIEKLKANGFVVGDKTQKSYQLIGAYDGTGVSVNKTDIEIYQFTDAQKDAQNKALGTLATVDNNIFESGSLLVLVYSTDKGITASIKNALEK